MHLSTNLMKTTILCIASLATALLALNSCSEDDDRSIEAPDGQYRLVERLCFCGPPEDGTIEYWIFDRSAESMSVRVVDSTGKELSCEQRVY